MSGSQDMNKWRIRAFIALAVSAVIAIDAVCKLHAVKEEYMVQLQAAWNTGYDAALLEARAGDLYRDPSGNLWRSEDEYRKWLDNKETGKRFF
jgi:hypothetical protein